MLKDIKNISETTFYSKQEIISNLDLNAPYGKAFKRLGIYGVGYNLVWPPFCMIRRGDTESTHYNLMYVLEGAYLMETADRDYVFNAGDFVSIPSWITRRFTCLKGDRLASIYIGISGERESPFQFQDVIVQPSTEMEQIKDAYFKLNSEIFNSDQYSQSIAKCYAELICNHLLREVRNLCMPQEREVLLKFNGLWEKVERDLSRKWTVKKLAAEMSVSSSYLFAQCRRFQGMSPLKKVSFMRIDYARRMLISGTKSLQEIAEETGFNSEFAFSKSFKNATGISPGRFRNQSRSIL
jgi:AraC-like DNA-binding protein